VPLSCTKDGIYLAGGALSGNAYLWEVSLSNCLIIKWTCIKICFLLVRSQKPSSQYQFLYMDI
jgi:hypothetical protein